MEKRYVEWSKVSKKIVFEHAKRRAYYFYMDENRISELRRRVRGGLRYIDGSTYCSSFALPPELKRKLMRPAPVIRDVHAMAARRPTVAGGIVSSLWAFEDSGQR